jgi:AbrB family looped-hinge helix DNA binding protein
MTIVKLHFDGWLTLPAVIRRQLELETGDALTIQVQDGAILLRREASGLVEAPASIVGPDEEEAEEPSAAVASVEVAKPAPATRKPKKEAAAPASSPRLAMSKVRAVGGRKKAISGTSPSH